MKNKKLVVAVATALTAASAVPALALENQFNGAFTAFFDTSNFSSSGVVQDKAPTTNYFVQRLRLGYNAKADDHVKLVTKFEFDYSYWGNNAYAVGRNQGGALGADTVNIETKSIYLDLDYPMVHAKIGMMPNTDSFKGLLFDADMAGILLSHDYDKASVSAGFFRLGDSNDKVHNPFGANEDYTRLGRNTADMFTLDGKYKVSNDLTVGGGYYYINDNSDMTSTVNQSTKLHNIGVNATANLGPVTVDGLFLKQFGDLSKTVDAKGYAINVGAKMPVAGGTARTQFLYVSGGDEQFYVVNGRGGTEGGQFYDSEMIMLGRDKWATTIDNSLIYDVNNFGEGVIMGTLGYDYNFTDKLSAAANVGFAAVADKVATATAARNDFFGGSLTRGKGDYLGTEFNAEAYYKLTANVTLGARGGYVVVGNYFADNVDNLWDFKLIANYSF